MSRIIVAVADREIRLTLQRLYHQVDYTFIETHDGDECLAAAAEERPDIILMDSDLPDTDTFTLCARLFATTRVPLLMIIPDDIQSAESAFAAGASDVITRPIHLTTLHYRLRHFLQVSEMNVLVQQEEWYRDIVENALGGIYRSTPDGRFIFVNQALVKMLGYGSVDEVMTLNISTDVVLERKGREQLRVELDAVGRIDGLEILWKKKTGEPVMVSIYARTIRDLQGQIIYYEGIALDITERKRMEATEREQRQLVDALRAAAATLNNVLDHDTVLDNILMCVRQVMPTDLMDIFLIENGVARSVRRFGYHERNLDQAIIKLRLKVDETENLRLMTATQRPLVIADVQSFPGWIPIEGFSWTRSIMGAPIRIEGQVIGFLQVDSAKIGAFSQYQADALQAFADQAGIAIHNARLYEATRQHARQLEERVAERTAELEGERIQLQAIMNSISEGVNGVIFGENSDITVYRYTNQALEELFGYAAHEWDLMLLRPDHVDEEDYLEKMSHVRKIVLENGVWQGEMQFRHKDGHLLDVNLTTTRVGGPNEQAIGSVSVFRDIGAEKRLTAQQERFVASAAHELRTPISSMKARVYLAQAQPEKAEKHLGILERIIEQMQTLVEELLDLSRFENGLITLHRSSIELRRFIEDIVEIQGVEAQNRGIHLVCEFPGGPALIDADPTRLYQVVTNLLTNAIQYTPSGEQVTIRVLTHQADSGQNNHTAIEVEDTGTGIAPEHLPHIFEPFYRANKGIGKGMGLGLSISKDIIQLHGGELMVSSQIGKGTIFRIWLPETPLE